MTNALANFVTKYSTSWGLAAMTCCLVVAVGCPAKDKPTSLRSNSVAAGNGGAGGSAGRSDTIGNGPVGVDGPPVAPPVPCGTTQCLSMGTPLDGFVLQQPCCADESKGLCGWTPPAGNGACTLPPPVVDVCPPSTIGQKGCCIANINRCGIDGSMYAAGCYNLAESPFAANSPDIVPRTCDGKPASLVSDNDAGVVVEEDAGMTIEQEDAGTSAPRK
jgi:hypothetical protein